MRGIQREKKKRKEKEGGDDDPARSRQTASVLQSVETKRVSKGSRESQDQDKSSNGKNAWPTRKRKGKLGSRWWCRRAGGTARYEQAMLTRSQTIKMFMSMMVHNRVSKSRQSSSQNTKVQPRNDNLQTISAS